MEINKRITRPIFLILITAFLLRIITGIILFSGHMPFLSGCYQKGFWECGYVEFVEIATNLAEGKGFYRVDEIEGELRSARPPLYPLILAGLYISFGKRSIPPVILQSIIGVLTVLFVYLIARQIFSKEVGILASILAAIYPYFVFHDTNLQETALFTLLSAVTVFFLLKTSKYRHLSDSFLAGVFLSFAVLTRTTLLLTLPFAVLWLMFVLKNNRTKMVLVMLLGFVIVSSPWLIRNVVIYGKPVFDIRSGVALWVGHNPYTLTGYPYEHIDKMTAKAWAAIPDVEKKEYSSLSEIKRDSWFKQKAIQFIRENPSNVLKGAILKVYAVMGWKLSPNTGSWVKNLSYTIAYLPLLLLGVVGAFLARDKWKELSIIYSLFFTFISISAVFLGHTNHRIYLDVYLMILAAYTIVRIKDFIKGKRFGEKPV